MSDIVLLDGFPKKYIPYMHRNHRWIRGDIQITKWLKEKSLNSISKFKIFDNIRRSLLNISVLNLLLSGVIILNNNIFLGTEIIVFSFLSIIINYLIDILDYIILKKSRLEDSINASKKFSKDYNRIILGLIRSFLSISLLPYEAFKNFDAVIKSIIRMKTKKNLLQWTTAEDSEKKSITSVGFYYKEMYINVIFGIFFLLFSHSMTKILGIIWIVSPSLMLKLSKERNKKQKYNTDDKKMLLEIGKRTWDFFSDFINSENNYLIIDNFQEDRTEKIVKRTSSTNIGLEILSVISAFDLNYIDLETTKKYLKNILTTIKLLPKWNGHLYNWYKTDTLEPLSPRYISTVDSGNFIGYLFVLKVFLEELNLTNDLYNAVCKLIDQTDFSALYNEKVKLLSIGYSIEENALTDSYYDFLASEARQASFIAIAKKDIPDKHWNYLSRILTTMGKYKGLVSWTGTAFEYLMPNLIMKRYEGSLLDESSKFAVYIQRKYAKQFFIPWGISESAYNLKDLNHHYQYKAFGIPWLGLKRGLEDDLVISPYSTFLALNDAKNYGILNIKKLIDEGAYGKYGFYESIDYTPKRLKIGKKKEIIKTYMAHHQGLILNSINNYLNDNILIKRFNTNPEIKAVDVLTQEKMPKDMIITKQKKRKIHKLKTSGNNYYIERTIKSIDNKHHKANVLTNDNYSLTIYDDGQSISLYKNTMITLYKKTNELWQGTHFYIKNLKNQKIIDFYSNAEVHFFPDKSKFIKMDNNLKLEMSITIDPNNPLEVRTLSITNIGNSEEFVEVISDFIPVLSIPNQEYAHPAFNKLFLSIEEKDENIIVKRKDRKLKRSVFLGTTLYTENSQISNFEYEIDREKYIGRKNFEIPQAIQKNEKFSSEISLKTDYIVAMKRTLKINPNEKARIHFILFTGENKEKIIEKLNLIKSNNEIEKIYEIEQARAEEELKYLQTSSSQAMQYYELLDYILDNNFSMNKELDFSKVFKKSILWKFGISENIPIILLKINKIEDLYILEELIDAFIFFRNKNIYLNLIIINYQDDKNNLVKNSIEELMLVKQVEYLKNTSMGIHIYEDKELNNEEKEILNFKSKLVIENADNLKNFLKSIMLKKEEIKDLRKKEIIKIDNKNKEEKFLNTYGEFSDSGKEYIIEIKASYQLPTVWTNILANKFFGTIVTENMGGFTWNKNSRLNRLTAWNNDPILDLSSEIIYIKDINTGKIWTLNNTLNSENNNYNIIYGFGYTKYINEQSQINQETTIFVPENDNLKITNIKFRNNSEEKKVLKVLLYLKDVMGEDEVFTCGDINLTRIDNSIIGRNCIEQEGFENKLMFINSNCKIKSYTGEKNNFFGNGDIINPEALFKEKLNNESGLGKNNCIAIEYELEIQAFEEKHLFFLLGEKNSLNDIEKITKEYNIEKIEKEYFKTVRYWENTLGIIKVKIPDKGLENLINGWALYQTITSRIFAKSSFYQSGGAYGFRDQLQDCLALKFIDSEILKNQIILCARHQFKEGDVLHWWHDETKRGIRTRFSDDLLWLVYATIEYIEFTGDYEILNEQIEYLIGEELNKTEDERYDIFYQTDEKDSLFNHCIKAIEKSLNFGKNGIPKIGTGDWNDGFSNIGRKGKRRKRMAGIFLI